MLETTGNERKTQTGPEHNLAQSDTYSDLKIIVERMFLSNQLFATTIVSRGSAIVPWQPDSKDRGKSQHSVTPELAAAPKGALLPSHN